MEQQELGATYIYSYYFFKNLKKMGIIKKLQSSARERVAIPLTTHLLAVTNA